MSIKDKYIKFNCLDRNNPGEWFDHYFPIGSPDLKKEVRARMGVGVFTFHVYEGIGTNEYGEPVSYRATGEMTFVNTTKRVGELI